MSDSKTTTEHTSLRLPRELLERADHLAESVGIGATRTGTLRSAIEAGLAELEKRFAVPPFTAAAK